MKMSEHHKRAILNICFAYTGRHDIQQGIDLMRTAVAHGVLAPEDVTEELIDRSLYTAPYSQVDLLVRTSGRCCVPVLGVRCGCGCVSVSVSVSVC